VTTSEGTTNTASGTTLVIGEALMDVVVTADGTREYPGGSPMNVSAGLALLEVPTTFLTRLGADDRGDRVRQRLDDAGVTLAAGSVDQLATSTATATIDASGAASYQFDVEWDLRPEVNPRGVSHLHFGSIAAFLSPGAAKVAQWVETVRASATVSYDPNIRPQFLADRHATLDAVRRHVSASDIVKASLEDVHWLYPGRTAADVAVEWLSRGPSLVVVTDGANGAIAACTAGLVTIAALSVPVADTIGAGDAFMSGLIAALGERGYLGTGRSSLKNISLDIVKDVANSATLCAALTVGKSGAVPPTLAELHAAHLA
jgi:fructokinase